MKKGSYQIIDLENHNHTSGVGFIHEGIYDLIEGTSKPILLSGLTLNAIEYHDTFIFPCVNGSNYVALVGTNPTENETIIINIQDNDVVTFNITTSPN